MTTGGDVITATIRPFALLAPLGPGTTLAAVTDVATETKDVAIIDTLLRDGITRLVAFATRANHARAIFAGRHRAPIRRLRAVRRIGTRNDVLGVSVIVTTGNGGVHTPNIGITAIGGARVAIVTIHNGALIRYARSARTVRRSITLVFAGDTNAIIIAHTCVGLKQERLCVCVREISALIGTRYRQRVVAEKLSQVQ